MTDVNPSNSANNHQPANLNTSKISPVAPDFTASSPGSQPASTDSKPQKPTGGLYSRHWLWKVLAITFVLSLVSWLCAWLSVKLLFRFCNTSNDCNSGFSVIWVYELWYYGMIVLLAAIGAFLLRKFVTTKWLIAGLAMVPALALFVTLRSTPTYYLLPHIGSGNIALEYLWGMLINTLFLGGPLIVSLLIFRLTNRVNWIWSVLVCLVLTPLAYVLVRYTSNRIYTTVTTAQVNHAYAKIPFTVYQPSFALPGYTVVPADSGLVPPVAEIADPEYMMIDYGDYYQQMVLNDYSLYEYKLGKDYNPPGDCGGTFNQILYGSSKSTPCPLVGQTSGGVPIYSVNSYGSLFAWTKVHNTVVVFDADTSAGNSATLQNDSFDQTSDINTQYGLITQIFSSLQPISDQKAKTLNQ
jgi:hypothetical protein